MHNQRKFSMKHTLTSRLLPAFALVLVAACSPSAAGIVGIHATSQATQTTADLVVSGSSFTPGGRVEINIFDWPRLGDMGPFFTAADSSGGFSRTESRGFAEVPRDQELAPIRVTVRDEATGRFAATSTSANPFVHRF